MIRTLGGKHSCHQDATSGQAIAGSTGSVDYCLNYDPYGRALTCAGLSQPSSSTIRFGYAGGEWISKGGFYHYGARMYDPALLRWTMPDPVLQPTDPGHANRYGYVSGNVANLTDPAGTHPCGSPGLHAPQGENNQCSRPAIACPLEDFDAPCPVSRGGLGEVLGNKIPGVLSAAASMARGCAFGFFTGGPGGCVRGAARGLGFNLGWSTDEAR